MCEQLLCSILIHRIANKHFIATSQAELVNGITGYYYWIIYIFFLVIWSPLQLVNKDSQEGTMIDANALHVIVKNDLVITVSMWHHLVYTYKISYELFYCQHFARHWQNFCMMLYCQLSTKVCKIRLRIWQRNRESKV